MQKFDTSLFTIKPLTSNIDVSNFFCSEDELNDYLKHDALRDQEYLFSSTNVMFYDTVLVGFFTLLNDTINPSFVDEKIDEKYHYAKLPALKIARLAVDKKYAGCGAGTMMLSFIYNVVFSAVKYSGCRVITVDAKQSARTFYERFGFKMVKSKKETETIPMYIDVKILMEALNP